MLINVDTGIRHLKNLSPLLCKISSTLSRILASPKCHAGCLSALVVLARGLHWLPLLVLKTKNSRNLGCLCMKDKIRLIRYLVASRRIIIIMICKLRTRRSSPNPRNSSSNHPRAYPCLQITNCLLYLYPSLRGIHPPCGTLGLVQMKLIRVKMAFSLEEQTQASSKKTQIKFPLNHALNPL